MTVSSDLTASPEYLALLRAILVQPEDDTLRLVMADWLEERGEGERAEFIRVQCELAELEATWSGLREAKHKARESLRNRQRELLRAHWDNWFFWAIPNRGYTYRAPNLPGIEITHGDGTRTAFDTARGFVYKIRCTMARFMVEECERCRGRGEVYSEIYFSPGLCPKCGGRCRTPGLVDTIFASQPVTEVALTDLQIREVDDSGVVSIDIDQPGDRQHLNLFAAMYTNAEHAAREVSRICVALGRMRAGLPLIPTQYN